MAKAPEVEHLQDGIRSGDTAAFERLVRLMTEPLFQYAASIVHDPGAAEEVVQNTFIRVFKRRRSLDAARSLRGYCYRIATNLARNHLRDRRLRREREVEALNMREHTAPDPQLTAIAREAWQMVDRLPDDIRTTLELRFGHGLTLTEVAHALDIPEGTVSTRQRTGLKDLRDRLALTLPFVPALNQLDTALHAAELPAVPASPGLVTRVETLVMASVSTKSAINLTILAIVAALLVGGGIIVAAVAWPASTQTNAANTVASTPGNSLPAETNRPRPKDNTPVADTTPVPVEPDPTVTHEPPAPQGLPYKATVRGKVVDSSGRAIAGATVAAQPLNAFEVGQYGLVDTSYQPASGSALTDARGEFELALSGRNPAAADRVYFTLAPDAKGMIGLRTNPYWVVAGESLDGLKLTLFRGGRVEGLVVSDSDRESPVPGVPVHLLRWPLGDDEIGSLVHEPRGVSAEDGTFAFDNLPPGSYSAWVDAPADEGYFAGVRIDASATLTEGGTARGLILPYADSLLTFSTEPAVDFIWLSVKSEVQRAELLGYSHSFRSASGRFRIRGLPADATAVTIKAGGFADYSADITAGKHIDLGTIRLQRRALAGRVVDESGAGVGGATLELLDESGYMEATATAAADGAFEIGFEPGTWTLTAQHAGFAQTRTSVTLPAEPVTLTLRPGGSIVGTVKIGSREPTPQQLGATSQSYVTVSAALLAEDEDPATIETWHTGRSAGPGGVFKLADLAPGRYAVRAEFGDCAGFAGPINVVAGQEARADVDVPLGGVVTGRVIGRDGKPLVGMSVYLTTKAALDFFWKWNARSAKVDAEGRFRLDFVKPGAYYVRLDNDPELMGSEQLASRAVDVVEGETAEIDIDLSAVTGPIIRGKVTVNGAGRFRDAVLVTPDAAFSLRTATIDEQGNFELSGMKPGNYYLWFADSKWSPKLFHRQSVKVGERDVIEINRDFTGSRLSGRVVVADAGDGFDYSKVTIQLKANVVDDIGVDAVSDLAGFRTTCNAEGEFVLDTLVEGPYRVIATAPGKPAVERTIDMSRDAQLDFVVGGRAGSLKIEIDQVKGGDTAGPLPESGLLADAVVVAVINSEGREMALTDLQRYVELKAGGNTTVDSLLPGTYRVQIRGLYAESLTASVDIREGETTTWKPTLQRAAILKLKVLNAELSLAEVRAARIEVYDREGALVPDATTPLDVGSADVANKLITVTSLKAGAYRVVVKLDGYLDTEVEVQIDQSHVSEREITLKK